MFPARFHRLSRALDLALEFATLGELRPAEHLDTREELAAGRQETPAAAGLAPSLPPPFPPATASTCPPATAAGRRAAEERRAVEEREAARLARLCAPCSGGRDGRSPTQPKRRPGRERAGAVQVPEQPCLWTGP
jgi:hypothetical protein